MTTGQKYKAVAISCCLRQKGPNVFLTMAILCILWPFSKLIKVHTLTSPPVSKISHFQKEGKELGLYFLCKIKNVFRYCKSFSDKENTVLFCRTYRICTGMENAVFERERDPVVVFCISAQHCHPSKNNLLKQPKMLIYTFRA